MPDTDTSSADSAPPPTTMTPPADAPATMSTSDAARLLASLRKRKDPAPVEPAAPAAAAPVEQSEPPAQAESDAAPPVAEDPGETTESADPDAAAAQAEAEPPIEPPRSWTREARERWQSLPRETQEYLASREQERERELRRGQNEAAEMRKAIEAERAAVETARQQYESALPQLLATLQSQVAGEFADIRSVADLERLAAEDWPRYLRWDLQQKKIAAAAQELAAAQQRDQAERQQKFAEFATTQDRLLAEKVPDMADKARAATTMARRCFIQEIYGKMEKRKGRGESPGPPNAKPPGP